MCYSAMVRQNFAALARRYGAEIAWEMIEQLFHQRLDDDDIKLSRALEMNFTHPGSEVERRIKIDIDAYTAKRVAMQEQELLKQGARLADAERSLAGKETKAARESARIASSKIATITQRLADSRRTEPRESDSRIFPMVYAPVIYQVGKRRFIGPMRYQCRLANKPANYDVRYPGTYNARRDSLEGFWSGVYGHRHAVMVISDFFENVPRHTFEHRELGPGESQSNLVLNFAPKQPVDMLVACLWDHWTGPGQRELYSFAAITRDAPPEIAATGHPRGLIPLREQYLDEWLAPESVTKERLQQILDDCELLYFDHEIAA